MLSPRPRASLCPRPSATRTLTGTWEHSHPWSVRRPDARAQLSSPPGPARVAPLHKPPLERCAGLRVPRSPRHSPSALSGPIEGRGGELTAPGSASSTARTNRSTLRHPEPGRSRCGARSGSARGLRRNCAQLGGVALDGVGPGLEAVARAWGCVGPEPPPCPRGHSLGLQAGCTSQAGRLPARRTAAAAGSLQLLAAQRRRGGREPTLRGPAAPAPAMQRAGGGGHCAVRGEAGGP